MFVYHRFRSSGLRSLRGSIGSTRLAQLFTHLPHGTFQQVVGVARKLRFSARYPEMQFTGLQCLVFINALGALPDALGDMSGAGGACVG
jgi:hypothetical protein